MSKIQFFELKIDVVKANHEENVDAFLSWKLTSQSGRDFKSHSDIAELTKVTRSVFHKKKQIDS